MKLHPRISRFKGYEVKSATFNDCMHYRNYKNALKCAKQEDEYAKHLKEKEAIKKWVNSELIIKRIEKK